MSDHDAFLTCRRVAPGPGAAARWLVGLGGPCGAAIAERARAPANIVVILPDSGMKAIVAMVLSSTGSVSMLIKTPRTVLDRRRFHRPRLGPRLEDAWKLVFYRPIRDTCPEVTHCAGALGSWAVAHGALHRLGGQQRDIPFGYLDMRRNVFARRDGSRSCHRGCRRLVGSDSWCRADSGSAA